MRALALVLLLGGCHNCGPGTSSTGGGAVYHADPVVVPDEPRPEVGDLPPALRPSVPGLRAPGALGSWM